MELKVDLHPLTYEDMCQMELMHCTAAGATVTGLNNANANTTAATIMPTIMVIPTAIMPSGTAHLIATTTDAAAAASIVNAANAPNTTPLSVICDSEFNEKHQHQQQQQQQQQHHPPPTHHFYRLQPTHILATAKNSPNTEYNLDAAQSTTALLLQPTVVAATTNCEHQQQRPHQALNILYTGTLSNSAEPTLLARKNFECSTLPRNFQPISGNITNKIAKSAICSATAAAATAAATEESDFEGSECGTGATTTTCMPHFRFGGCSMLIQTVPHHQQHQQHQQRQPHSYQQTGESSEVTGCAALGHMMGSFAAAAGDVVYNSGRGLAGTLGKHRYNQRQNNENIEQTPKRVSFKDIDRSEPISQFGSTDKEEILQMLDISNLKLPKISTTPPPPPPPPPASLLPISLPSSLSLQHLQPSHMADAYNNCTYMNFNHFMDYQTTGFGGLPDVTEHSNIRHTISRQNSTSNSDSGGEISSTQKTCKSNFDINTKSSSSISTGSIRLNSIDPATSLHGNFKVKRKKVKILQDNLESHHKAVHRGSCVIGLTLFAALCLLAVAAVLLYQHFIMSPNRNSHAQRLSIVKRILRDVPLVDGHNNFAWNIRKYAHSSLELVHVSNDINHKSMWMRPAWAQTDMTRLKLGQVGVQVWSAYVPCEAQGLDAVQLALEQIDIIRRLTDMYSQDTILVTSSKDIQTAQRHGLMASIIGIEGGHTIGSSLGVLRSFYSLGARYLSITHKCDVSWAGSSSSTLDAGLSGFGKAIVREMNRLGMMIDLSYSSDTTARDVLQATRAPVIFSHSGARQLCNSTRNIPDDILRMLAENGGLIMISFDSEDVTCGRQAHLRDVIDHIQYVRAIAGIQHIGLGAGYDSIEYPPIGLEDVSKYPDLLATLLEDVSWSEEDIAMLAGKNFLRIMETVENVRDYWKRANIDPIEQTEPLPKTQCTYMSS